MDVAVKTLFKYDMNLLANTILTSRDLENSCLEKKTSSTSLENAARHVFLLKTTIGHIYPFLKDVLPIMKASDYYKPHTLEILKAFMAFESITLWSSNIIVASDVLQFIGKDLQWFRHKTQQPRKRKISDSVTKRDYPVYMEYDSQLKGYGCDKCFSISKSLATLNLHFYFEHAKNQVGEISEKTKKIKLDDQQTSDQSTDKGTNEDLDGDWLLV